MNVEPLLNLLNITPNDVKMILICAVLFVLLWRGLARFFFAPYLKVVEARERLTVGAHDYSSAIDERAAALVTDYEAQLLAARSAAMKLRADRVTAAKKEAQAITDAAQHKAQEDLKKVRTDITARVGALRTEAERDAESLAQSVVERVMSSAAIAGLMIGAALFANSFFGAAHAFAAEHSGQHPAGIESLTLFFVNFGIFAVLMFMLIKSRFAAGWPVRYQRLSSAVNAGKIRLAEAEGRLAAAESRLNSVASEIRSIQETMEQETVRECAEIVRSAHATAERINKSAEQTRQAEDRAARIAIRRELGRLVMQRAEAKLRSQISADSDRKNRDSAIGGVSRLMN